MHKIKYCIFLSVITKENELNFIWNGFFFFVFEK